MRSVTLHNSPIRKDDTQQPDSQRRFFIVPNAHVTRLRTSNGVVTSIDVSVGGSLRSLSVSSNSAVVLALGTIESTRLALASFPTNPNNPGARSEERRVG